MKWYRIDFFRGMVNDIRRRVRYYVSDWTDAWDYRVVPATVYMYFAKEVLIILVPARDFESGS
jgi:boron transporter